MKALTLLPKKIKKNYQIIRNKRRISVHHPTYVNIDFDKDFRIETNGVTWTIVNSKVSVSLWIDTHFIHVSVFS